MKNLITETMSLTTSKGDKVQYSFPENGYDHDHQKARQYLVEGAAYIVKKIDVGNSHSSVEFREFPGIWFNTVLFENAKE